MGAWGMGPWDNDGSADWISGTYNRWLLEQLHEFDGTPVVVRAIVEIVIQSIGTFAALGVEGLTRVHDALTRSCSEEWLRGWDSYDAITADVARQRMIITAEIERIKASKHRNERIQKHRGAAGASESSPVS